VRSANDREEEVLFESVEFPSEGARLRGRLYRPDRPGPFPAVVMAHGTTATITMAIDRYAEVFCAGGLGVLLYDHRNFGASGGEPRQEINPWIQARGYRDAVSYLLTRGDVRPDKVAIWGDSYSGGLALVVAALDRRVAAVVRETLDEMGWTGWPKTSGNRGIHVACRIEPKWEFPVVRRCALAFAREVERRSELVTTAWWKEERGERVFIDYNQNARDRTIASAYSVRGRPDATVSAPVTWDELPEVETEDFTLATMPARFAKLGDVQAGIDDAVCDLNVLLEWVEREEKSGVGEAPYPPQFPKMPGEPKRVQPSRAKKAD